MKFLLDTDHISILERKSGAEFRALVARVRKVDPSDLVLSIASFHEQSLGCHAYINAAANRAETIRGYDMLDRLLRLYSRSQALPFDSAAADVFDNLKGNRTRIGTMDLRIAATALSRNLTLLTRNASHFSQVPGLNFEDWTR